MYSQLRMLLLHSVCTGIPITYMYISSHYNYYLIFSGVYGVHGISDGILPPQPTNTYNYFLLFNRIRSVICIIVETRA